MICSDDISNIQILTYHKSMQQIKKSHDTWNCNMYHSVSSCVTKAISKHITVKKNNLCIKIFQYLIIIQELQLMP